MKTFLIMLFLAFASLAKAQKNDRTVCWCALLKDKGITKTGSKVQPVCYFDSCPDFPGGYKAFNKFLAKNIKWPKIDKHVSGTVFIEFIVEKNGKLSNIRVGHGLTESLNNEVLRVIKLSPNWVPAKLKGKNFRCRYLACVPFKME